MNTRIYIINDSNRLVFGRRDDVWAGERAVTSCYIQLRLFFSGGKEKREKRRKKGNVTEILC